MADVAIAKALGFDEHRVLVAVDEHVANGQAVSGRLAFGPQLVASAAEERDVAGRTASRPRLPGS